MYPQLALLLAIILRFFAKILMAKKLKKIETEKEIILRRLTEYIEYAEGRHWYSDVGFYKDLTEFIENNCNET